MSFSPGLDGCWKLFWAGLMFFTSFLFGLSGCTNTWLTIPQPVAICSKCTKKKNKSINGWSNWPPKFCPHFTKASFGFFARRTHEINPHDLRNPSFHCVRTTHNKRSPREEAWRRVNGAGWGGREHNTDCAVKDKHAIGCIHSQESQPPGGSHLPREKFNISHEWFSNSAET